MTPNPEKLHTSDLSKDAAHAHGTIKESLEVTLRELQRLQRLVVKPGWTTPAEFLLVRGGVLGAASRAQALARDVVALVDAADKVGQVSGVIIIDG